MKLLAIESSGMSVGCAYFEDGRLISEYYMNSKLTHSVTLLPMISEMQKTSGFELKDLDVIAVSKGPGSFTGLRIGAAAAKGLGLALEIPIVGVSSLKAMAFNVPAPGMLLCPIMDARRGQIYGAAYVCEKDTLTAVIEDVAMEIGEYLEMVSEYIEKTGMKAMFLGDGVPVHQELISAKLGDIAVFAPTTVNRQRASSVAYLGAKEYESGNTVSSDDFVPDYLRRPLAETSKEDGSLEDAGIHSLKKISRGDFKRTRHPEEPGKE